MPRQVALAVENNFVKGLVTEKTPLQFPADACTETFNCVFDNTGRITRRNAFDAEVGSAPEFLSRTALIDQEAYTEFLWKTVAGDGNITFFVQQKGGTLYFYDCSNTVNFSNNRKSFSVSLNSFIVSGSSLQPGNSNCQYAVGNGNLIVVNRATNPLLVIYSPSSDTITTTALILKFRDFTGVEDGLGLTERPATDVPGLKTTNPEHFYNIINQGWYSGDALSQWDTARADLPANSDMVILYRKDSTDAFDPARVDAKTGANTPAPKGHFILKVGAVDRTAALVDDGFAGATLTPGTGTISAGIGTILNINSEWSFETQAFDSDTTQIASQTARIFGPLTNFHGLGKHFTVSPFRITKAIVYGSTSDGFGLVFHTVANITLELRARQTTAPSSPTDGTLLATSTFVGGADESAGRTLTSSDTSTFWDYVWINIKTDNGAETQLLVAEIQFFTVPGTTQEQVTVERATTTAFFSSRAWYAGINDVGLNSNIYFSQIITDDTQYAKCYQKNDPSSEDFFELLPDDGGLIRIPEIGKIVKLFPYQTSMVVIASNGVWLISGSVDKGFAADDFSVRKLSSIGTHSGLSVVDAKGVPMWWAEDGIYTLNFKADYNSFEVVSTTTNTIQSFFDAIPQDARLFAKGAYDLLDFKIYWTFSSIGSGYVYDSVLALDTVTGAFYPWTLPTGTRRIVGICYIQEASHQDEPLIKYTLVDDINANPTSVTYGGFVRTTDFLDWGTDDYESFFISGYRVDGKGQTFFQSNYLYVFLDTVSDSSCFMQGLWDWANSGDSGKWSRRQQVFNQDSLNRAVSVRRLKVRGKGRALQFKFTSETGKPFSIIGWSLYETQNATP